MMDYIIIDELEFERLDLGGESPIYKYQGEYFTGIAVTYDDDDGMVSSEEEYHAGYRERWIRFYCPNGQLQTEYKDHDNELVGGTYKKYGENGNLLISDNE